ncbi:hypothetical protein [Streptomyces sp. S.PB5]|uniref:hypothetical protein n=1 Tax=Streptomyces sp. S.PB5 TaxID=3020844 RepID=UPI0025B1A56A|nr:hypothetical protein [Streptomyces sp. S.PB5]MDN3025622.1 hypothetical protein [Streptomyces sp. S.PB5]
MSRSPRTSPTTAPTGPPGRPGTTRAEPSRTARTAGAVVVQEHGCGFATLLALTGPLAGTLWWDGRATCDLILPLSPDHVRGARPVTFGEWLGRDSWELLPPGWG